MATVLITGSSGFVGKAMTKHLVAQGHVVMLFDRDQPFLNRFDLYDLAGPRCNTLLSSGIESADAVLHLAGNADTAAHRNREVQANDIVAATRVLTVCAMFEKPVLVASSAYALTRNTPYGWTKGVIEDLALAFRERGHPVGIVRLFNLYGPGQEQAVTYRGTVMTDLIRRFAAGDTIAVSDDQERDFVFIDDAVRMIEQAMFRPPEQVVEIGSGVMTSIWDVARLIAQELGCGDLLSRTTAGAGGLAPYDRPARTLVGLAGTPLGLGIAKTVNHITSQWKEAAR